MWWIEIGFGSSKTHRSATEFDSGPSWSVGSWWTKMSPGRDILSRWIQRMGGNPTEEALQRSSRPCTRDEKKYLPQDGGVCSRLWDAMVQLVYCARLIFFSGARWLSDTAGNDFFCARWCSMSGTCKAKNKTHEQTLNIYRLSRDHWGNWKVSREKDRFHLC